MSLTPICDFVIWTKHLHGDGAVREMILQLRPGETIELAVDGVVGAWRRMDDGRDGRPTAGVRPVGLAQAAWRDLYKLRRGDMVRVELAEAAVVSPGLTIYPPAAKTDVERRAAMEAFLASGEQGWTSNAPYGSRDELYDR